MTDIANIITQLEQQKTAIENAIAALHMVSGNAAARPAAEAKPRGGPRRGMSAEGRQRQIEAMRQYWAAKKAGDTGRAKKATEPAKKKRTLSAAGRKRLSENMKRRWAEKKTAAKGKK